MNITNLTEVKPNLINNINLSNNNSSVTINTSNDNLIIEDTLDLSLNYSDDNISSIIDEIKNNFSSNFVLTNHNDSIEDYSSKYGNILSKIQTSKDFSKGDIENLTKILDTTFDEYAEDLSKEMANNIGSFLNTAYLAQKAYEENGVNMGITGERLVDIEKLSSTIKDMFISSRNFLKNNPLAKNQDVSKFLENKFSETTTIENLSYKDLNSLEKAINISKNQTSENPMPDLSFDISPSRKTEAMKKALESLVNDNASNIVINTFQKAKDQNTSYNLRINAYQKIRFNFSEQLDKMFSSLAEYQNKLEQLEEERKEMLKQNTENLKKLTEKLNKESLKLSLFNMKNTIDQVQALKEQQEKSIHRLDEQKLNLEGRIKDHTKMFKDTAEQYQRFLKSPASSIDDYLEN